MSARLKGMKPRATWVKLEKFVMSSLFHPRNSASSWLAVSSQKELNSSIILVKLSTVFTDRSELVQGLVFVRDGRTASSIKGCKLRKWDDFD